MYLKSFGQNLNHAFNKKKPLYYVWLTYEEHVGKGREYVSQVLLKKM